MAKTKEKAEKYPSGYAAMGHRVPPHRLSNAYKTIKEIIPNISTEDAMTVVGKMANCVERDDPYGALLDHSDGYATARPIDLTGSYRLLAVLCTD